MLVVTTRVKLLLDTVVVETDRNTDLSISREIKTVWPAKVIGIEYDPNRTANIALICYADGEKVIYPRS